MAPTEANHGSGDVGARPSPPEQHQPAAQQTEQDPDNISLPQTPKTAQRAFDLTDNDHPGADVDSTRADLANDAPGVPAPHVRFMMDSPPHPEARLTPPPAPGTGPGSNPPWSNRTKAWFDDQDENGPPIGLGLTLYPPATPGAPGVAGDPVVPAPEGRSADRPEKEGVGSGGSAATCGGQLSSSSSSSSGTK